jgi:exonuclease SbcD
MKFLHTADWHVGKVLRGADRRKEQGAVLRQIAQIAVSEQVDAVLVAGDVYENSAPTADAQRLVVQTLVALAGRGIEVVVIAGNHDNGSTLEAYRPLMDLAGIHVFGRPRSVADGGVHTFRARSTGERVNVAALPFLSQRYAVRAYEIVSNTPAQNVGEYDQLLRDVIANLATGFTDDAVNVFMAHLTCTGGTVGGGERAAQTIFEYHVPANVFPADTHYVALGHLHRRQKIEAACPVHYSGAPFRVDFGEQDYTPVVCLVEAAPGTPSLVRDIPVTSGRALVTAEGTAAQLIARADEFGDAFLRLVITEPAYAELRDDLLEALPNTLEIRIHPDHATTAARAGLATSVPRRTPLELFQDYCGVAGVSDERVVSLFTSIHDELTSR